MLPKRDSLISLWTLAMDAKKGNNSCAALLTAEEVSIVGGSDPHCWKWASTNDTISGRVLNVAELIEVSGLQIDGEYNANNLTKGLKYGVYFVVELKDNFNVNGPVTLKLARPDGGTVEHEENLLTHPRNKRIGLKVGEFFKSAGTCDNNVKFSITGCNNTTPKTGLTIIGAVIGPIIF